MFNNGSNSAVERGIGYLERIIDLIVRLLNALLGGGSSSTTTTTTAPETTTEAPAEGV